MYCILMHYPHCKRPLACRDIYEDGHCSYATVTPTQPGMCWLSCDGAAQLSHPQLLLETGCSYQAGTVAYPLEIDMMSML